MGIAENKALARDYLARLEASDLDAAFGMFAPDGKVWLPGVGTVPLANFAAIVKRFHAMVVGKMKLAIVSMVAEGDRVAVEVEGGADLKRGARYDNNYHFVFVIADGKIALLKEYMNTVAAQAAWTDAGEPPP